MTHRISLLEPWKRAKQHWSTLLSLSQPVINEQQPVAAQIDLHTRQISVNPRWIQDYQLTPYLEALLAHEIGHHLHYPGTLARHARLRLLEKRYFSWGKKHSVLNGFMDFMINRHLGQVPLLRQQLQAIYAHLPHPTDPLNRLYQALYTELWQAPAETVTINEPATLRLATQWLEFITPYPSLCAHLEEPFLYFASLLSPFILALPTDAIPADHSHPALEPDADDWVQALTPSAAEQQAILHGQQQGWLQPATPSKSTANNHNEWQQRLFALLQDQTAQQQRQIMGLYYYQQAQRYLFQPPPVHQGGEPLQPLHHEDWPIGESPQAIDWLASFLQRGPELGIAQPLQRTSAPEWEGQTQPWQQPRLEIYLDTSGSMPHPCQMINPLTLAAQILMLAAIRQGGWARILLYSGPQEVLAHWAWCRSGLELAQFSMHYLGTGTAFPFERLATSIAECKPYPPIRVIISDADFDDNYQNHPKAAPVLHQAITYSKQLVLLLYRPTGSGLGKTRHFEQLGAQVITLNHLTDFPALATQLGQYWFPAH